MKPKIMFLLAAAMLLTYPVTVFAATSEKTAAQIALSDKDTLDLGLTSVATSDLLLPTTGKDGSTITWKSSNNNLIEANGTVHRPEIGAGNKEVTLTATIKNGKYKETKKFTITVMEKYAAYIMSYFGDKHKYDSLYLAYSTDALHWTALNDNKPILDATIGTQHIRDPFILRKQDGNFVVMATNNWSSPEIYMWDSKDLLTYTNERLVTMNHSNTHAWAPECTYDPVNKNYVIYWAGDVMFSNTTTDFNTVSEPTEFFNPGHKVIDADITSWKSNYYMVAKHEGYGSLITARSSSLTPGSFKQLTPDYITSNLKDNEGPVIIKSLTEDKWYLYYDFYRSHSYGVSYTTDLDSGIWHEVPASEFSVPQGMRHSNAVGITKRELDALIAKWGTKQPNN